MNMLEIKELSEIGYGTWGVGGYMEKDPNNDDTKQIKAIRYALDNGINYIDTASMYGGGYSLEIITKALKGFDRSQIFINAKITGSIDRYEDIEKQTDAYLKQFNTDYLDSIQLHAPWRTNIGLEKTFTGIQELVGKKKVRYLSVSNFIIEQIELFNSVTGNYPFSHELDYNFEVRINDEIGVVKECQKNNVRILTYRTLRKNKTAKRNYDLLVELAKKYDKTQNQIILNWLANKKLFLPLVMSSNIEHIEENLGSIDFELSLEDYKRIERYRIKFDWPKPDLYLTGEGLKISKYSNYLEEKLGD